MILRFWEIEKENMSYFKSKKSYMFRSENFADELIDAGFDFLLALNRTLKLISALGVPAHNHLASTCG